MPRDNAQPEHLSGGNRARRVDPELLEELLLGAPHAGPGLIARTAERVKELGYVPGPGYRSGSITGQVDHHHEDSGDDDRVFALYLVLKRWLGHAVDEASERAYLARYRTTDVAAILGDPSKKVVGLMSQVKVRVKQFLHGETNERIDLCLNLSELLMNWLGGRCYHLDMAPIPADDGITVLSCKCGVTVHERKGVWLAV